MKPQSLQTRHRPEEAGLPAARRPEHPRDAPGGQREVGVELEGAPPEPDPELQPSAARDAGERGVGYIGHFIRVDGFAKKGFGMGLIDFFLGLVELISEVAKILSFSFRLFGNIFAGEVLMIVIISLVSLLVLVLIFGLEIFVGTIQAFVFFILALVFFAIAVQHHGEEH